MFESKMEKIDIEISKLRDEQKKKYGETYNLFELLNFLTSDEVDAMISISNRTDGKTYSYTKVLLKLNEMFGLKFMLIGRHYTLRKQMLKTVTEIMNDENTHDTKNISFNNNEAYIDVIGKGGKTVCCITDLNSATDLKYSATDLRKYDIIVYDEFIAFEHEYLSYEVEAMKMIYETMDRHYKGRILQNQKLLFLGNAINFSSPFISYYDIFNDIETQEMNTLQVVKKLTNSNKELKIAIELRRNDIVNESKNCKLFDMGGNNYALSGEFDTNNYLIYRGKTMPAEFTVIRFDDKYIKVYYDNNHIILSALDYSKEYSYCNRICDIRENVEYLNEKYFDKKHLFAMFDKSIQYANTYTLRYISDRQELQHLDYTDIVSDLMYNVVQVEKMKEYKNTYNRELAVLFKFHEQSIA